MEAYEYILRGRALAWLHHRESVVEARRLLARAIWLDPSYASAYSWLAFAHSIEFINEWTDSPIETRRVGYDLARKAVELDGTDAQAHFVLGEYHLWAESDHQSAIGAANRAQQLEPNYSHAHLLLGHALHYEGKPEESLGPFKHAMRLDPCFPDLYLHFLAQSYYNLQRYEDAIEALEERLSRNPHTDISRVLLAACYGQTGRLDEARSAWHEALAFNPNYSVEQRRRILPYKNPADFERMVEGLHSAGLPT